MEPIAITPVREQVTTSLRKAIFNGEIAEGQEITQEEIAKMLGVSRMPVREAFMLLEREGLLILKSRRATVRGLTNEDLFDHYEIRGMLEGKAAAKAAEKHEDLAELEKWYEKLEQAASIGDSSSYITANEAFHKTIWKLSGSTKLNSLLQQLWEGLPIRLPEIIPDQMIKSLEEHRFILESIKERDREKAMNAMQTHVERSKEDFMSNR